MDDGAIFGAIDAVSVAAHPSGSPANRRSRALLFTTERWPTAALLAHALTKGDFDVAALCPSGHPLRAVVGLEASPVYNHLSRHAQLARAVDRYNPDLIVPCDDTAVAVLHHHHALCRATPTAQTRASLIERSLGDPRHFGLLRRKSAFIGLAAAQGVRTPATVDIPNVNDLRTHLAGATFPMVVKADGWSGGRGTRIVWTSQEAVDAFETLSRPLGWTSAVKDSLREGALQPLWRRLAFEAPVVTLQAFAPGSPVNRAVFCRDGVVLAGRTFEAVETMPNNGNATVVRPRRIPAIDSAVERCAALLGLSGFAGFDFMYDEATDAAYLLEVNPRATSACYTAPRGEPGLAAIVGTVMTGGSPQSEPIAGDGNGSPIALFPQEMERDPQSRYLRDAEQQVPLDQPDLVNACLAVAARRTLYARAVETVRRVRSDRHGAASPQPRQRGGPKVVAGRG